MALAAGSLPSTITVKPGKVSSTRSSTDRKTTQTSTFHYQAALYAIAEHAVDIILSEV